MCEHQTLHTRECKEVELGNTIADYCVIWLDPDETPFTCCSKECCKDHYIPAVEEWAEEIRSAQDIRNEGSMAVGQVANIKFEVHLRLCCSVSWGDLRAARLAALNGCGLPIDRHIDEDGEFLW